jgi:hypothetical protein
VTTPACPIGDSGLMPRKSQVQNPAPAHSRHRPRPDAKGRPDAARGRTSQSVTRSAGACRRTGDEVQFHRLGRLPQVGLDSRTQSRWVEWPGRLDFRFYLESTWIVGRTPLPRDEALQPLNVKVPSEDLYFVQEVLKPALGVSYNAEAVREVLVQLRTCFRLPQYVVDVLEAEMKAKKLNILGYVQELLLRRYEAIRDKEARVARPPVGSSRRAR